ncbi:major facilitator superfamily domain-containing protein [Lipomyces oligophaga]|uniref:major facilitator superfamily domain-containing protein n=1 Tax=Lipomyces oligophaga TaxID=45792 RepID=UPI0034CF7174
MAFFESIFEEIGLRSVFNATRDVHLLFLQRFLRMFAYGQVTIILVVFLTLLGFSESKVGLFMTCTLLGDVVLSFLLTLVADKLGRRRVLAVGALMMGLSGVVFSYAFKFWVLLVASIVGVISPSGNEIGPFRAVEESTIAHLTDLRIRPDIYAWYAFLGSLGAALGTISCGWIVQYLQEEYNWSPLLACRVIFFIYSIIAMVKLIITLMLSPATELEQLPTEPSEPSAEAIDEADGASRPSESYPLKNLSTDDVHDQSADIDEVYEEMNAMGPQPKKRSKWLVWIDLFPRFSRKTARTIAKLTILFALDSFGSGLATQSWLAYYFTSRFETKEGVLGSLFFVTNLVSAGSSIIAASIAKRLGAVITMVATHLPSSIIITILGAPSNPAVAMTLLVIRSCTQSMDVGPRQAFLSAIVTQQERTSVMGIVNMIRTLAQAAGPSLMGKFASINKMWIGFMIAGFCKIIYDLGILWSFVGVQLHK